MCFRRRRIPEAIGPNMNRMGAHWMDDLSMQDKSLQPSSGDYCWRLSSLLWTGFSFGLKRDPWTITLMRCSSVRVSSPNRPQT